MTSKKLLEETSSCFRGNVKLYKVNYLTIKFCYTFCCTIAIHKLAKPFCRCIILTLRKTKIKLILHFKS